MRSTAGLPPLRPLNVLLSSVCVYLFCAMFAVGWTERDDHCCRGVTGLLWNFNFAELWSLYYC